MKTSPCSLIVALSTAVLPVWAETWLLTDGTRLEAEVRLVTPGLVIFTEAMGKDKLVEVGKLSDVSRKRLAEVLGLAKERAEEIAARPKLPPDPTAMDVADLDLIDSLYGQKGKVIGVVKEVITLGRLGHKKLVFEGTSFTVFISKRTLEQAAGWQLDDLAGKVVRVTGEISKYREQLQIAPKEPGDISKPLPRP